ncbi:MAG: hypothetical protein KAH23_10070 [Kiritimatiellae bacterium]|nr:hypothetical protein [Kiritimatiellia bacterium]
MQAYLRDRTLDQMEPPLTFEELSIAGGFNFEFTPLVDGEYMVQVRAYKTLNPEKRLLLLSESEQRVFLYKESGAKELKGTAGTSPPKTSI